MMPCFSLNTQLKPHRKKGHFYPLLINSGNNSKNKSFTLHHKVLYHE